MKETGASPIIRIVEEYNEPVVTIKDVARKVFRNPKERSKQYLESLLPIMTWIHKYNLIWLYSDLIAGITVGIVVVPQGMSYAKIAGLPVQYGLYASFIGVILYPFFATSKDVTIGPVAVMSAEVYKVISRVVEKTSYTWDDGPAIASTLGLLCGGITMGIGLLRLGFVLDYISTPAVMGFMSGSAFTIAAGQIPSLLGLNKLFDTRAACYLVVVNTLKHLGSTNLNAAFGLVCLFSLYAIKYFCDYMSKRDPRRKKVYFYISSLRAAVVIIFSTLIAWGVCKSHNHDKNFPISIIQNVPRGLQDVGVHPVKKDVVNAMASQLPISTVILLLEHIAIAKSFGRINDYRINPNQELIAIGAANLVGHFFNAYPNTGSFSRSALKSKCGVRTPLAGVYTGIVVLVAIYGLTDAFFYISNAALSAVIIHSVLDLIASYKTTWGFWRMSPIECVIFLVDIILCVFVSIEAGIYFSLAASLVWLLLRVSFPVGKFLGKVEYEHVVDPIILASQPSHATTTPENEVEEVKEIDYIEAVDPTKVSEEKHQEKVAVTPVSWPNAALSKLTTYTSPMSCSVKDSPNSPNLLSGEEKQVSILAKKTVIWVPLNHSGINPDVLVTPPPPGVFVYRFCESLTYPNASRQLEHLVEHIRERCRRNIDTSKPLKLGDRPWNDGAPRNFKPDPTFVDKRPLLREVVFDLSGTPHIDLTAINQLQDTQKELVKFANGDVKFHFVGVLSPWARRALIGGGFGTADNLDHRFVDLARSETDLEAQRPLVATSTPLFHLSIPTI